tara:strand:- start:9493 stop:11376 length:1884 start_codon:yes stop_codon:yes gene_type:complete
VKPEQPFSFGTSPESIDAEETQPFSPELLMSLKGDAAPSDVQEEVALLSIDDMLSESADDLDDATITGDSLQDELPSGSLESQSLVDHPDKPVSPPQSPKPKLDPNVGMVLGNFRLVQKIGQGGFGSVYKAEQIHLQQPFAVKLLKAEHHNEPSLIERFRREARALATLKHDGIVQLADFGLLGDGQDGFYLAMEFLEGRSLSRVLKREWPLPLERISNIVRQICSVLHYVHHKGVLHRDLKPGNILLIEDAFGGEKVKLIDFGIASLAEEGQSITKEGTYVGSPAYMSPEQGKGEQVDHRSDLYALGVIMYKLFVKRAPFVGDGFPAVISQHLFQDPPKLEDIDPSRPWSPALNAFLHRVLAKAPEDRPQDAHTFWIECKQALEEQAKLGAGPADYGHSARVDTSKAFPVFQDTPIPVQQHISLSEPSDFSDVSSKEEDSDVSLSGAFTSERKSMWLPVGGVFGVIVLVVAGLFMGGVFDKKKTAPPVGQRRHMAKVRQKSKARTRNVVRRSIPDVRPQTRDVVEPSKVPLVQPKPIVREVKAPTMFSFEIKSIPSGAQVWIKRKKVGETPFILKAKQGESILFSLRKEQHKKKWVKWSFRKDKQTRVYKLKKKKKIYEGLDGAPI